MKPTINNTQLKQERVCLNCGSGYDSGNAKRQYCSDSCRVAYFRKNQSQTIREQEQTVQHQMATIQELTDAPIRRTESVRVVNPSWQLARQAYDAQEVRCDRTKKMLTTNSDEAHKLTSGRAGAQVGACAGFAFVLVLMSIRYDNRQNKSLGIAFPVTSAVFLIAMTFIGYWIGKYVHHNIIADNGNINMKLVQLTNEYELLETQLETETNCLDGLGRKLSQLSQYESQTITSTDEIRVLTPVAVD